MRVSTAAIYTLTALVAKDLTQQAIAAPNPEAPSDAATAEITAALEADDVVVLVNPIAPTESIATPPLSSTLPPASSPIEATALDLGQDSGYNLIQDPSQDSSQNFSQDSAENAPTVSTSIEASTPIAVPENLTLFPLAETTRSTNLLATEHSVSPDRPSTEDLFSQTTDEATLMAQLVAQSTSSGLPTYAPVEPVGIPTDAEVDDLQRRLEEVPEAVDFGDVYQGSPAITISNPTGYGADNFEAFAAIGFQSDKRYEDGADAGLSVGIGLGDATEIAGLQLSYTLSSFGSQNRDFGSGGFNAKLHRRFDNGLGVAVGWEGFATLGDDVDFEDTVYGALSYVIRTNQDLDAPFSRVALTAGVGNGRFRSEDAVNNDDDTVGVFGSVAMRVLPPLSAIVEWTGQDLAAGLSIVPIPNFPLVITPAVRDITGAGDGARFVVGMGVAFQL